MTWILKSTSACGRKNDRWLLPLLLMAAVCCASLAHSGDVSAHASMVKSDPPRRSVISTQPEELRLWFNENIEPTYVFAAVLDADGVAATSGKAEVAKDDPKQVRLPLPRLKPGKYTVKYKVMSVDGHVVDWSYGFVLSPPFERK
jgi:methionine-rich copper-binding protein CopC